MSAIARKPTPHGRDRIHCARNPLCRRVAPVTRESRTLEGACECGAVRYRVADEFRYAANCHCSRCRAATGTAFKSFAGIERPQLVVTAGADNLFVFGDDDL